MARVVVTGFEPFDALPHNPSAAVLALLPRTIAGHPVETAVLPVDTHRVGAALAALPSDDVAMVLHLGLAADRAVVSIERVALNLLDFGRPDNAGNLVVDAEVIAGAPLALPVRLPVRRILAAWTEAMIPAAASTSAGTFLCNQVLYTSLTTRAQETAVGFVHLPPDETLALRARLAHQPLDVQARAVVCAIEATLAERGASRAG